MYCTIQTATPSTASLSSDARGAHRRLCRHAESLAGLSASFLTEALTVATAYADALGCGSRDSWVSFVAAAAALAGHSATVASIVDLSAQEAEAYDFFAGIVRENDDLLVAAALSPLNAQ